MVGETDPSRHPSTNRPSGGARRECLKWVTAGLVGAVAGCTARNDDLDGTVSGNRNATTGSERSPAGTATPSPVTGLRADDGDPDDGFGLSVDVSGETALVGAPNDEDPHGERSGSAYVFSRTDGGWEQRAKLVPADGQPRERFGSDVALDGATALVGVDYDGHQGAGDAGAAYVFSRSSEGWHREAILTPEDGDTEHEYGRSVALDGTTALIGADADTAPADDNAGAAFVFSRTSEGWEQDAKLVPADRSRVIGFGWSVALAGDTALVGTVMEEGVSRAEGGPVYVFSRTDGGWAQRAKLFPADGGPAEHFGGAIAIDDDTAFVGAYFERNANGVEGGSVYVFSRDGDGWEQRETLIAAAGGSHDLFGSDVDVDGGSAVIAARRDGGPNVSGTGSAYVFSRRDGGWEQRTKLADGDRVDLPAHSVAIDGDAALAAGPGNEEAGAGYVYEL